MAAPPHEDKIRRLFLEEASEHVQVLNEQLLVLEQRPDDCQECLTALLRAAHTIKGSAAAAGLSRVELLVHNWETCVEQISMGKAELSAHALELLYRGLDQIERVVQEECTGEAVATETTPPTVDELKGVFGSDLPFLVSEDRFKDDKTPQERRYVEDGTTIRVSTKKVENLMTCIEDLVQVKAGGAKREHDVKHLEATIEEMGRGLERFRSLLRETKGNAHLLGNIDQLRRIQEEASRLSNALSQDMRHHLHVLEGLSGRLQDDIRAVRMVPIEEAFTTFPRVVRDLSRKLGKSVSFHLEGGNTEIDRDLLDVLKDPVLHLLRNAVSHGIEAAEERAVAGKSVEGNVSIRAEGRAGGLQLTIEDDGKGIDRERIRRTAVQRGLVSVDEANALDEGEVMQLIFLPGFSTAQSVDEVSGRGVGLDIVRESVERCGGNVLLESIPGAGTKFTLRLPLNLTSMRMLILRVSSELFAVPVAAVDRVLRVSSDDVKQVDDGLAVDVGGRPVAIDRLARVMGTRIQDESVKRRPAIVLRSGSSRAAILVDAIEGELELIVKTLGGHLLRIPHISGATVLANGRLVPLLHVPDVVRSLAASRYKGGLFAENTATKQARHRVLIADDSITTRTLEKSILEAAGYSVEVATDGVDALQKLKQSPFHLVLSDFQMPRMDGLELVARIKADEKLRDIPVVLVSSLASDEDRARGLRAGADAYLGKGEFTQELLLQTLERLL